MFKFRNMKKYIVWSIYSLSGNHIQDQISARSVGEAMEKADRLPHRLSYEAVEVDNYEHGNLPKSRSNSINIHEYNPN